MSVTNIPQSHETNEMQHIKNQSHWRVILSSLGIFMATVYPIFMYLVFTKDCFEERHLLRLITLVLPFLYSTIQYLFLLYTNWKNGHKQEDILYNILYYLLNLLLTTFSIISILSIIALIINRRENDDDLFFFSVILPSMPLTYLLSTSCCLVPGQIGFIDTGINIFIDILILSCLVSLTLICIEPKDYLCFIAISSALTLVRLLKKKYLSSKQSPPPTAPWRVAIFVLIFSFVVFIYVLAACGSITALDYHFHLFDKVKSILS
ncbi:hypothetical protein M970_082060 [Encephalitozoon cuniculi EcunIII-L]|uniref:Uncharacterized protein n=1 Tax=Encephalitozoon cuniculi TaxID=6035 RepID=M1K6B3_ENCCN|nr:hypothetical protein ECU08_2060 [Encephalitozoon cuniculi]KMV65729.1 hypothetical protein M970_082060 [Encephalitozoon cuniculi EcunIII-L]UYI27136.1 DUF2463 domain-containing protein [Encephalitozoon cuniculi]